MSRIHLGLLVILTLSIAGCGGYGSNNMGGGGGAPSITSLSPNMTNAGDPAFTLTVNGTNFVNGSVVRWNGSNRTTTFVSGTGLTASILASDIASSGTAVVSVFSAGPGGGTSNTLNFTILSQPPVITSPTSTVGKQGTAFLYQIGATTNPTSYNATGLPGGLIVSGTTGLISGTPVAASTATVTLSATNAGGTGNQSLAMTIFSGCDLNNDGNINVLDLQTEVNEVLQVTSCTDDINKDGACNVLDLQRLVNAVLGGSCVVGP